VRLQSLPDWLSSPESSQYGLGEHHFSNYDFKKIVGIVYLNKDST
jgi:hypothetical protein